MCSLLLYSWSPDPSDLAEPVRQVYTTCNSAGFHLCQLVTQSEWPELLIWEQNRNYLQIVHGYISNRWIMKILSLNSSLSYRHLAT